MAMDRVFAIKYPFAHKKYSSKRVSRTIVWTVTVFAYLIPSGTLYLYDIRPDGKENQKMQNIRAETKIN